MSPTPVVYFIILLHIFHGVRGANFTIVNNCSETIWPAFISYNARGPQVETTGFELPNGSSRAIKVPAGWSGHLWGRTGCNFSISGSGHGGCATGDCGTGQIQCNGNGSTTAATTLIEFAIRQFNSQDFYDVSLVDGFNLPVFVEVIGGSGDCKSVGCVEDINQRCPAELKTKGGDACFSACSMFKTDLHCCAGEYASPSTCIPTLYSRVFKSACPDAYTYAYEDATSTFNCSAADYVCTFCPTRGSGSPPVEEQEVPPEIVPAPAPSPSAQTPGSFPWPSLFGIIGGSLLGITLTTALAITIVKSRRSKSNSEEECNRIVENLILQHEYLAPKRDKYSEIKKLTKSFSDKLGQGGYGSVYKGTLPNGCLVAVKVLVNTDSNGEEFINEVASISRTSHVNIVNLLGFCLDKTKRALIYEFMPNKSLDKFISSSSADYLLDLEKLYKIAVGVAKGLEYLHTGCNTRIVHFDIKPQNILLDEDFCPKISDFGLAKLCKKKQSILSMLGARGTAGYIAPEVFSRNFGGVSHKSDVYSYGMMVLEMAGARKIEEAETINSTENYFPDKIYEQVVANATQREDDVMVEEKEEERARKMLLVGFWCIQTTPSNRPAMSKVVEMLEGSIQSIKIPPKPTLFCPSNLSEQEISPSLSEYEETETSVEDIYK